MGEFSTDDASVLYVSRDRVPVEDPSESSAEALEELEEIEDDAFRRVLREEMSGAL